MRTNQLLGISFAIVIPAVFTGSAISMAGEHLDARMVDYHDAIGMAIFTLIPMFFAWIGCLIYCGDKD